jgi:hypothetical protein
MSGLHRMFQSTGLPQEDDHARVVAVASVPVLLVQCSRLGGVLEETKTGE